MSHGDNVGVRAMPPMSPFQITWLAHLRARAQICFQLPIRIHKELPDTQPNSAEPARGPSSYPLPPAPTKTKPKYLTLVPHSRDTALSPESKEE